MSFVPVRYHKTKKDIDEIMNSSVDDDDITLELILMVDHAYHSNDVDYDGGLSFLDRLHHKLSMYYDIKWNVPNLKDMIRTSKNPAITFVDILSEILDDGKIGCYGL